MYHKYRYDASRVGVRGSVRSYVWNFVLSKREMPVENSRN